MYNFRCTSNIDSGGNLSRWISKWKLQLNFRSFYIIRRQVFGWERSVSLWMVFATPTEGDDVHCNLFYTSTTGLDGDFLRWIASWKFCPHIRTFHIIRSEVFRRWMVFLLRQSQRIHVAKMHWCKCHYVKVVATAQLRSPTIDRELTQKRRRDARIAESKKLMLNRRFRLLNRRNWRFNVF